MSNILQNAVKITEGNEITYLPSNHRHHFNAYEFKNGSSYFVDGGRDYFRKGSKGDFPSDSKIESFSLMEDSSFEEISEKLLWGTHGKSGKEPIKFLPFKELTKKHLLAILAYDDKLSIKLSNIQKKVINHWLNNN